MEHGANINHKDYNDYTPLITVCSEIDNCEASRNIKRIKYSKYKNIKKYLIEHGAK